MPLFPQILTANSPRDMQSQMASMKKYKKLKYLGKGSYGCAILVVLKSDPTQQFVMKEIVIGHLTPSEQQAAKNEAEVLRQMAHSNITIYIESFVESSKLYIVMEFADGGDLAAAVKRRRETGKKWGESEVMRIFVQICLALKHVHNANILHRDLKSQNIFLTSKGIVKLGDFGIARLLDSSVDHANTQIGTPYYLSPEICESLPYGQKSDVWSLGIVLFELCALELPFQAQSLPALVHRICTTDPQYDKIESDFSPPMISMLKSLLRRLADERPSVKELVKFPYVKSHICELLSHTLNAGTGGGEGALDRPAAVRTDKLSEEQSTILDLKRERDMNRQAALIQAEKIQSERKEKIRRFKLDMIKKKEKQREKERLAGLDAGPLVSVDHLVEVTTSNTKSEGTLEASPREMKENMSPIVRLTSVHPSTTPRVHVQLTPIPLSSVDCDKPIRTPSPRCEQQQQPFTDPSRLSEPKRHQLPAMPPRYEEQRQQLQYHPAQYTPSHQYQSSVALAVASIALDEPRTQSRLQRQAQLPSRSSEDSDYESAARREFFANRAAAQAFRAKASAFATSPEYISPSSSRAGDVNRPLLSANGRAGIDGHAVVRGGTPNGNSSMAPLSRGEISPESRIAHVRALKGLEKERARLEQEKQLQEAYEANRIARLELAQRRKVEANGRGGVGRPIINFSSDFVNCADNCSKSNCNNSDNERSQSPSPTQSESEVLSRSIAAVKAPVNENDDNTLVSNVIRPHVAGDIVDGSEGRGVWGQPVDLEPLKVQQEMTVSSSSARSFASTYVEGEDAQLSPLLEEKAAQQREARQKAKLAFRLRREKRLALLTGASTAAGVDVNAKEVKPLVLCDNSNAVFPKSTNVSTESAKDEADRLPQPLWDEEVGICLEETLDRWYSHAQAQAGTKRRHRNIDRPYLKSITKHGLLPVQKDSCDAVHVYTIGLSSDNGPDAPHETAGDVASPDAPLLPVSYTSSSSKSSISEGEGLYEVSRGSGEVAGLQCVLADELMAFDEKD